MYIPRANKEDRIPVLHNFMQDQPFASLITMGSSGLFASHIPMVLEQNGAMGHLKCHISRANTQWRDFTPDDPGARDLLRPAALHHAFLVPGKAGDRQELSPPGTMSWFTPTGISRSSKITEWLMAHLASLTRFSRKPPFPLPGRSKTLPADYIASQIKGIVGLEMTIDRLEGKWKVSQNRSEQDRSGVAEGLAELNTTESLAMKALVERRD